MMLAAVTTVCMTTTIALKMKLAITGKSRLGYSYAKVFEIVVQSSAVQSTVMLASGIIRLIIYEVDANATSHGGRTLHEICMQQVYDWWHGPYILSTSFILSELHRLPGNRA